MRIRVFVPVGAYIGSAVIEHNVCFEMLSVALDLVKALLACYVLLDGNAVWNWFNWIEVYSNNKTLLRSVL